MEIIRTGEPALSGSSLHSSRRGETWLVVTLLMLWLLIASCAASDARPSDSVDGNPSSEPVDGQEHEDPQAAARDFGIQNAKHPEQGLVFGGQPTEDQLRELAASGYSVVNLRMPDEDAGFSETDLVEQLGVDYFGIPVNGAALEDAETYQRFYRAMDEAERPTLVHCASGNRVGALYYAYLVERGGKEPDEALEIARANGLRSDALAEAVTQHLARETPE